MKINEVGVFSFAIVVSVLSFVVAFFFYFWVKAQASSNNRIAQVSELIRRGANTFLKREYIVLSRFAGVIALLILVFLPQPIWTGSPKSNIIMTVSYILGTVLSAVAGKIGIEVATIANRKTAEAATKGIKPSFLVGFRGGAVMGMAVVGTSLLGVTLVFALTHETSAVLGFSFGASSLALFAKAGGGIFTKTADISADLCGKVELGIPEDDPRNPAVIADNVGDNVGDVAGMGADLFDSNVASMSAALVIAMALDKTAGAMLNIEMIFCYAALGLLSSAIGVLSARMGKKGDPTKALNSSTYVTTAIFAVLTAAATWLFNFHWRIWGATVIGLFVGVIIGIASDYFTNDTKKPVRFVAKASKSGPAFNILSGVSYGLLSVLPSMVGIALSALLAYNICAPIGEGYAMFGIAMSAMGSFQL